MRLVAAHAMRTCDAVRSHLSKLDHAQLRDAPRVFWVCQCFCEDIGGHVFRGEVLHFEFAVFHAFASKMMTNVHMFRAVVENRILRQQSGTLVVVENRRGWLLHMQDFSQESSEMNRFLRRVGQRHVFGLGT